MVSDTQMFADHLEQLDLALDQIAANDRNYDRFALMLIDNVVELVLHENAKKLSAKSAFGIHHPRIDPNSKLVVSAIGKDFNPKVRLAEECGLLSSDEGTSIRNLHMFRNTAHHLGHRHEGILHSLALFYLRLACGLLEGYSPIGWRSTGSDRVPHRAVKYLGTGDRYRVQENFKAAWRRLLEVSDAIGDSLVADLAGDMERTIESTDTLITYLADYDETRTRADVVIESQAWALAFTKKAKKFADENGCPERTVLGFVNWIGQNHPRIERNDPIRSWKRRLASLSNDGDPNRALKKYCDFMLQTEDIRAQINMAAAQLDQEVERQIEEARSRR